MSWWGSNSPPQAIVYPELPSPVSKEDFEQLADQCFDQLMRLDAEGSEAGWNSIPFQATNGEEEVKLWDKTIDGSPVTCLKSEASMPCSAKNLFNLLCEEDLTKRQEYEKDCTCYEVVREVTPEIVITRAQFKAPFPVVAREVVAIRVRRRLPGGGFVSFGKSINCAECLTDSSHVRAALHLVGAICRPIPGELNRCMLTRIAQLDPKGNIPTMVVNATKKKGGASMILLRKVIRNRNLLPAVEEEITEVVTSQYEDNDNNLTVTEAQEEKLLSHQVQAQSELVPIQPIQRDTLSQQTEQGKGKERTEAKPVLVDGDEMFYEAASSLPWDERPFREMYREHRDEINTIVSSLQDSIGRLERLTLANEQRLQSLERLCADMARHSGTHDQQRTGDTVHLTNLSWGSLAFLAVWPVLAYSVYDFISRSRPPRK